MRNLLIIFVLFYTLVSAQSNEIIRDDWNKYFNEFGFDGSFVLYDLNNDTFYRYNKEVCSQQFIPASTFKIPNTLIGLETGVITGKDFELKWDGVKREIETHNQDQNLETAFKYSAVWYYQEVARRIGEERMKKFVDSINYGNKNIGGGIDRFWLDGEIRISADEQIEFLKKIYHKELPFSERTFNILKEIMVYDKNDNYTIRAKTGWAVRSSNQTGWFVGYVERNENVYFFAVNIHSAKNQKDFGKARIEITKNILKEMKITE
ncbi:MAG: class D beta-lactamase [Ignavibacteriae bacterium]|nr:class D beta-lactamase [Ignavibacteriota bacterium]